MPSVTRSTTKYALLDPHVRQAIGWGADFQDATRLSINAGSYRHTAYVPLATFLAPAAGITNVDPGRQLQAAVRVLF